MYVLFFILGLIPSIIFFIQNIKNHKKKAFLAKYIWMKRITIKLIYQTKAKIEESEIENFTIYFLASNNLKFSLVLSANDEVYLHNNEDGSEVLVTSETILNYQDFIQKQETNENSTERK